MNTAFIVYASPQIGGQPRDLFVGDFPMKVELGNGTWIDVKIENATDRTAILVTPDGVRYQIILRRSDELGSGISFPGMHSQDWIVRSQVI